MLGSNLVSETDEVRGSPCIKQHFVELQTKLRSFGFSVTTDCDGTMALNKYPDGTLIGAHGHGAAVL
jgi:hypothetical protein